jgi:hypothetical protein
MRNTLFLCGALLAGCGGSIGDTPSERELDADADVDAAIADTSTTDDVAIVVDETAAETSAPPPDAPPVACIKARDKCGATSECCESYVCDVTPLPDLPPTDTRCCRAKDAPCAVHDDCCSYLLCNGGKCSARGVDGACRVDSDCTTNKCSAGKCIDPTSTTGYRLPLRCGGPYTVTQGNFDTKCTVYSHTGQSQYAYDWGVGLNTPVLAMRGGVVTHVRNDVKPGNPCYSGGGSGCINTVNYVTIKHPDGFGTVYVHLNDATVTVGQTVTQGQQIGLSGGTGWSTGPHMHVQKQQLCTAFYCQSVPLIFDEYPGRLDCGMMITSKNGC